MRGLIALAAIVSIIAGVALAVSRHKKTVYVARYQVMFEREGVVD